MNWKLDFSGGQRARHTSRRWWPQTGHRLTTMASGTLWHALVYYADYALTTLWHLSRGVAITTRHRASTSTRWHFAFGLCCRSNPCTDRKSAQ